MVRTLLVLVFVLIVGCAPAVSPPTAQPPGPAAPVTGVQPGIPARVEFLVHTAAGGGMDLLAREMIEMMKAEKLIDGAWTVNNVTGGGSGRAMAYLANQKGRSDVVAGITSVWVSGPLTSKEVTNSVKEYTPISALLTDANVVAVRADAPYRTMKDFIDAAKARPNQINQTGGSLTSADNLAREALQKVTGARWNFLSFAGGGERMAAVLGGTADLIVSQPPEIMEQVRAGKLRYIAVVGDKRLAALPDVPTLAEQGFNVDVPASTRGIMGPGDMPAAQVAAYDALFKRLTETKTWKDYIEKSLTVPAYMPSAEYKTFLDSELTKYDRFLTELGLKAQ